MTNTNTAREIEILIGMYSVQMPRTCMLAAAGNANAIHSLEMAAFQDETREQCGLALQRMSMRGIKIGAMHNRCHALAKVAKSWRARVILATMARIALNALPVADRT